MIQDTRFEGLSLGATTRGSIDLDNKSIDMNGVLIPAYAINDIINKIPLLGQIITGIEGEGIIGFNYRAFGSYENPEYTINPFSLLTRELLEAYLKVRKKIKKMKPNNFNYCVSFCSAEIYMFIILNIFFCNRVVKIFYLLPLILLPLLY